MVNGGGGLSTYQDIRGGDLPGGAGGEGVAVAHYLQWLLAEARWHAEINERQLMSAGIATDSILPWTEKVADANG